jgi:hypothetical protein
MWTSLGRRAISGLAVGATAAALVASGCGGGGEKVAASVVDDVVKFAQRSPAPRPAAPLRVSTPLPRSVSQASVSSERVAAFIACDGLNFYLQNGYLPGPSDWSNMFGGYLLSRVPAYQAQEIGQALEAMALSPDPDAPMRLFHTLGCAAF